MPLFRNLIQLSKSGICPDGTFKDPHNGFLFSKADPGSLKPICPFPDSQKLHVHTNFSFTDNSLYCSARLLTVFFQTIRHKSSCLVNIYMVKKVPVHEIAVALVIVS